MKKIISILIITSIVIMQTMGTCKAETPAQEMNTIGHIQRQLHYQNEGQQTFRILEYGDKTTYLLSRINHLLGNEYSQMQLLEDGAIKNILESGYPCIDLNTLKLSNWQDAYVATQESIYAYLENKNLDLYEGSQTHIIDAMKMITKGIKVKDIILTATSDGWVDDKINNAYCYKDYKVTMISKVSRAKIKLLGVEEGKVTDQEGNEISEVTNNQIIRIIVPKESNKNFNIQIDYMRKIPKIYQMTDNLQNGYLIVDFYKQDRQYSLKIDQHQYTSVTITNYNEETNLPIESNKFQILDESKNVYLDNLETNDEGKINFYLQKGNYYLKQIETKEGVLQSELLPITVTQDEKNIELNVYNSKFKQEEIVENQKEMNITQEEKVITQNNIKDIINICTTNVRKDIINQTNQTNLHKVNNFINTINRKTIKNLKQNNTYENEVFEDDIIIDEILPGEVLNTPILPVALRQ